MHLSAEKEGPPAGRKQGPEDQRKGILFLWDPESDQEGPSPSYSSVQYDIARWSYILGAVLLTSSSFFSRFSGWSSHITWVRACHAPALYMS